MKIGARTFKTGLAIFLSIIIPILVGYGEVSDLAAISVISSMQPSVKKSYIQVKDRVSANAIGGFIAYIFTVLFSNSPIMIAIAAILLIAILNYLKLNNVIGLSIMTLIIIMLKPANNVLYSAISRVLATILGVFIAFAVNSFIFPPRFHLRLYNLTNEITEEITRYIRISLRKNMQFGLMNKDLKKVKRKIDLSERYLGYIRDGDISSIFRRREIYSLSRLTAVYRQFIRANKELYQLSKVLHQSENIYNNFPNDLRLLIRERIEVLMSAHEQILQKWNGRVLPEDVNFIAYKADLRKRMMKMFFDQASLDSHLDNKFGDSNTVLRFMSTILEYEESLIQLNKLVSNYMKLHRNETKYVSDSDFDE